MADVALVSVGYGPAYEGEGSDRSFNLPWGQDALIEAVAAANPHTIVTLTSGGAVDARRWLDKVPALLITYYPGQEGGTAIAEILFGKLSPEGKLPVGFDRTWEEQSVVSVLLSHQRRGYGAARERARSSAGGHNGWSRELWR